MSDTKTKTKRKRKRPRPGGVEAYLLYPWRLLREPRIISAVLGITYFVLATMGSAGIADPEDSLPRGWQQPWAIIAWLLLVGGILGAASMWRRLWWLERVAIWMIIAACVGRVLVLSQIVAELGSFVIRSGFILVVVLMFVVRLIRIHGVPADPYRREP